MIVEITHLLQQNLLKNQANPQELVHVFREWKMAGELGEDDFYEFGKDAAYIAPSVNGTPYILRHVHLVPLVDMVQLAKWNRNWENYSRRTSNRALVYVQDNSRFLLIDILPEPDAHQICAMQTPQDKQLMEKFAEIAEAYIFRQEIIA